MQYLSPPRLGKSSRVTLLTLGWVWIVYQVSTGRAKVLSFHSRHHWEQEMGTKGNDRLKKQSICVQSQDSVLASDAPPSVSCSAFNNNCRHRKSARMAVAVACSVPSKARIVVCVSWWWLDSGVSLGCACRLCHSLFKTLAVLRWLQGRVQVEESWTCYPGRSVALWLDICFLK